MRMKRVKNLQDRSFRSSRRAFLSSTGANLIAAGGAVIGLGACSVSETTRAGGSNESGHNGVLPTQYRLVRAEGTHRELGRQHGEQADEQIRAHLDHIGRSRDQLQSQALQFKPLFEKYCPHLLDEITGLGEGAGITLAEALAVNIRGELGKANAEGCTTYVIGRKGTADGEILIGQNSDMGKRNIELGYMLHLKPKDKPQVLIWTFGGMIGYHGINSTGVAIFENALSGDGAVPAGRFAMPHYPVKRRILESSRLDEVLDIFWNIPLASNKNYVMCDGAGGILDIEATTAGPEILRDEGAGFLAHSNHFVCARYVNQESPDAGLPDSIQRFDRINELIRAELGSVTVDRIKTYLSDHSNYPTSICRHPQTPRRGPERTVASMIAEPAHGRMHVALGNPCESSFVTYAMDA
jgi:isopenicillin-N N-acyltransferase-like protein